MAYIMIKNNRGANDANFMELQVALLSDISSLPDYPKCAFGSTCLCEEDFSIWILCSDNVWRPVE